MRTVTIGYSPCPNDTFIFYALTHARVTVPGIAFRERLEDVETLNRMALDGSLDITKISYHAFGHLRDQYALLRSGSALGRGCGPLIIAKPGISLDDLHAGRIAIPGELTTAHLLLRIFNPSFRNTVVMPFDQILSAVANGSVLAGVIIHESRFTYHLHGLQNLVDLGEWWERHSGKPIPLGGIIGKRSLGRDILLMTEDAIRRSLQYAQTHVDEALAYCTLHSQEMDSETMKSHIALYVNDFSLDLGAEGIDAVKRVLAEAESCGIIAPATQSLLADDMLA